MDSEKAFLKQFIKCYHSHPALWDSTSPEYIMKAKKIPGYKELRYIYRKYKADATIDDVKKKINSLRCSYRRELKKRMQYEMCGAGIDETSRPTLWWYPMMTFLQSCDSSITETFFKVDLQCDEISERKLPNQYASQKRLLKTFADEQISAYDLKTLADEQITADDLKTFYDEPALDDDQKLSADELISADEFPSTKKRTRSSNEYRLEKIPKLHKMERHSMSKPLDTFDYMAKTWSDKLRNMTNLQRMIAEKGVNDILFEGEMGTLTRDSIQIRSEFSSCHSPVE